MRTSSSGVRLNVNCKLRWLRELKILKKLCSPGRNVCYLIYCCLVLKRVINTGKVTCPNIVNKESLKDHHGISICIENQSCIALTLNQP